MADESELTWCKVNSSTVTDNGALIWSEDNSYLPEFELRPGECGFNLWVRWRMFENNLYYYPDLWVAIKMETDSDYEYVGPHISAAHRQRLVELRFESGEPNGLQMLMALLPPGGKLIAYGNGMDKELHAPPEHFKKGVTSSNDGFPQFKPF